jgi:cysteine desulfurase/selenocysteine lyase
VCSFNLDGVHAHDTATILAERGIAVRAGFHCAQPYVERLGAQGTVRASLAFFNTEEEIELLLEGIGEVRRIFGA